MDSEEENWYEYLYYRLKLYGGTSGTVKRISGSAMYNKVCLSTLIAKERKLLRELNDLRLRTWRFREARVLGVRNPSKLPQCIKKNIWEENFKDENKELNKQLTDLQRSISVCIRKLSRFREIEVSNDMDLEVIIYLKQQRIVPWNGSANLTSSLSMERQQEFVSELVRNGIPVIRVSDE